MHLIFIMKQIFMLLYILVRMDRIVILLQYYSIDKLDNFKRFIILKVIIVIIITISLSSQFSVTSYQSTQDCGDAQLS